MTTRRTLLTCVISVLAVLYIVAWLRPAIGLAYSDGATLVAAVTHRFTASPDAPLFPALLSLFVLVSRQAQWLKLAPLLCTIVWLVLTRRLLMKMGATRECAWVLIVMTAASPTVLYLSTNLFPEPLFALLMTACLLALLKDRPLVAGLCAGLATITLTAGATLIVACAVTLVTHRRLRSAAIFTGIAMVFAAPWLGWCLAHGRVPVFGNNIMLLAASPFTLLTGYPTLYPGLLTAVALLVVLIRRRQFVPDLFFGLYCLALLWRTESPLYAFAAVLPMLLWMLLRTVRGSRFAILIIIPALWFDAVPATPPDDWHQMETLFTFIRANTTPDSVLLADLDPVFYLNTGRKTVRGFSPSAPLTAYDLRTSVLRDHVTYVVLTPDRGLPESPAFHKAVAALERGGVLEPVTVPGVSGEYRLLRVD